MRVLPRVKNPDYIMFCDFDETYYPHKIANSDIQYEILTELENYIYSLSKKGQLLFGIITGNDLDFVLSKFDKGNYQFYPHFIASNLGTSLKYYEQGNIGVIDDEWDRIMTRNSYRLEVIDNILSKLKSENIHLEQQKPTKQLQYISSYFYHMRDPYTDVITLERIKYLANDNNIDMNISVCNPLAGDPIIVMTSILSRKIRVRMGLFVFC